MIGVLFLGVIVFIWFVLGDFTPFFKWVYQHIYEMLHILGAVGIISALCIYPIMIQARLKAKKLKARANCPSLFLCDVTGHVTILFVVFFCINVKL